MLMPKDFPLTSIVSQSGRIELPHGEALGTRDPMGVTVLASNTKAARKRLVREAEMAFGVWFARPAWGPYAGCAELAKTQPTHRVWWFDALGREHAALLHFADWYGYRKNAAPEHYTWMSFDDEPKPSSLEFERRTDPKQDHWHEPMVTRVDVLVDQRTLAAHPDWSVVRKALVTLGVSPLSTGLRAAEEMPLDSNTLRMRLTADTAALFIDAIRQREIVDAEHMRIVTGSRTPSLLS